jgi:hypothetical protein
VASTHPLDYLNKDAFFKAFRLNSSGFYVPPTLKVPDMSARSTSTKMAGVSDVFSIWGQRPPYQRMHSLPLKKEAEEEEFLLGHDLDHTIK